MGKSALSGDQCTSHGGRDKLQDVEVMDAFAGWCGIAANVRVELTKYVSDVRFDHVHA